MVTVDLTADVPDGRTFADPEYYIVTTNTDTKHIVLPNESTNITVEGNAETILSVTPFYTCRQEDNIVPSWSIECSMTTEGNNSVLYTCNI